jgi:hypothetical protein
MAPQYRWNNPQEWLLEKASQYADDVHKGGSTAIHAASCLYSLIDSLVNRSDADSIQNLFEAEMDEDGYFNEE